VFQSSSEFIEMAIKLAEQSPNTCVCSIAIEGGSFFDSIVRGFFGYHGKYTSNHSWINQAPEWLGSIKRWKVV
jgi:hypothetical protein